MRCSSLWSMAARISCEPIRSQNLVEFSKKIYSYPPSFFSPNFLLFFFLSNTVQEVHLAKGYTESIESYRLLWLSLCKATNDFASSVGATITICLIFHVLYLILDSYRYCVLMPEQIRNSRPREITLLLLDSAALLWVLFLYCNIGHNVPKYVSTIFAL